VRRATTPGTRTFFEDYLLRPVAGGATRLVWTAALAPEPWAFGVGPAFVATFRAVGAPSLRRLAALVDARAP
jgi:hypothetical protein